MKVGHEHPAVPGKPEALAKPSFPYIVPVSQALFLATGMLVPATDRHGLGAAKESPAIAPAIPHHPAADPRPGRPYAGALAGLERQRRQARPVSPRMAKKAAVRLWHRARDFDRGTHQAGRHGGAVGHTALAVLHALVFDFLNHRTGRLDPSYAAIAAQGRRLRAHGRHGAAPGCASWAS